MPHTVRSAPDIAVAAGRRQPIPHVSRGFADARSTFGADLSTVVLTAE
ncbi:hypothetical protein [Microbacterium sp. E-13]